MGFFEKDAGVFRVKCESSLRCKTTFVGDDVLGVPKIIKFAIVKRLFDFCSSSSHSQTKNRLFCGTPRTSSPTRLDLSCETHDTFNVGGDSKRSHFSFREGFSYRVSFISNAALANMEFLSYSPTNKTSFHIHKDSIRSRYFSICAQAHIKFLHRSKNCHRHL